MTIGAALVTLLVVLTVRVPAPRPTNVSIKVRWAPFVGSDAQAAAESRLHLTDRRFDGGRTWGYRLLDDTAQNIRALVLDPAVEDTAGLDRRGFRVVASTVTIAERATAQFPVLERLAGPGFNRWLSSEQAWPALLVAAWLAALSRPSVRALVSRGVPALSPLGLGLFRIALGLTLLAVLPAAVESPTLAVPRALHRSTGWFADWGWVHWLAMHPDANVLVLVVAVAALGMFAAGVVPRVAFLVALAAITTRVFVVLQSRSAHDLGLPLVALWGLALVPWDAGLSLVPWRRQREDNAAGHGYAIWWPGLVLGMALLAAAYAKLDASGLAWVTGGAVKYHALEDFRQAPTTWGLWIAAHPTWAVAASFAAIAVESLFILHVFVREPPMRALFGLLGLALLSGFYLLQGVFWPLWWVMLLAFLPWEGLAGKIRHRDRVLPAAHPIRLSYLVFVCGAVSVQIFASAHRTEVEPFVSHFGMYSWTWASPDAFDRQIARKYHTYRYAAEPPGGALDMTNRLGTLPGAVDALTSALDQSRQGADLAASQRDALRAVGEAYQAAFSAPAPQMAVLLDEQAFDWTLARFYQKVSGERIGVLDLAAGTFVPIAQVSGAR